MALYKNLAVLKFRDPRVTDQIWEVWQPPASKIKKPVAKDGDIQSGNCVCENYICGHYVFSGILEPHDQWTVCL